MGNFYVNNQSVGGINSFDSVVSKLMKALFFLTMLFPSVMLAQTTITTFNSLSTASLIGTVPSGTTAADVEGWDFTVYATAGNITVTRFPTPERIDDNDWSLRGNGSDPNAVSYVSFKKHGGDSFQLNSFNFRYGPDGISKEINVTGYKDGNTVPGASYTNASLIALSGTSAQYLIDLSSIVAFQDIDEFRVSASGGTGVNRILEFDNISTTVPEAEAQTITFEGCYGMNFRTPGPKWDLIVIDVDGTGRNVFYDDVDDGSTIGSATLKWNNNRWELSINAGGEKLMCYSDVATSPNPPTIASGNWQKAEGWAEACTGDDPILLSGDLMDAGGTSTIPTVTTTIPATAITATSAMLGGEVTADGGATVEERGIVWATTTDPTIADNKVPIDEGTGTFSQTVSGLPSGTMIYYRAYATNSVGTAYGDNVSFTTLATTNSNIIDFETGITIVPDHDPEIPFDMILTPFELSSSGKTFRFSLNGTVFDPTPTNYHNVDKVNYFNNGSSYGIAVARFNTDGGLVIETADASKFTFESIDFEDWFGWGNISFEGFRDGVSTGKETVSDVPYEELQTLMPTTDYFSNVDKIIITVEGDEFNLSGFFDNFIWSPPAGVETSAPTVATTAATAITATSATLGGDVTADGGATVEERGIVWATTTDPTIANNKVPIDEGTGIFSQTVSGLPAGTTVYYRAYATNSAGTAYGDNESFTTLAAPVGTTLSAGDIAFIGYNTTNDGFSFISLNDLPAGETLYFTEQGWNGTTWIPNGEMHLEWAIPGGITCGTIVTVLHQGGTSFSISSGSLTVYYDTNQSLTTSFLSGGDQILAYQSATGIFAPVNPTFIAGVHGDYNSEKFDPITKWNAPKTTGTPEGIIGAGESALPPGLTNGVNCVSLFPGVTEQAYSKYTGTLIGTSAELRASINNYANWEHIGPNDISPAGYATPNVDCTEGPTNTVPTATNLTHEISFTEDDASVALDDIVVTDSDAGETIIATLVLSNSAAGSLTTGTYGSATSTFNAGTGIWTLTGSVADVNAALAAVAFTPAANWDQDFTITTRIRDAADTGPGDGTINVTVTPVNDAPTATNLGQTLSFTEDDASVALNDIVVTDPDEGETITATLTISDPAAGSLTTGTYGAATSTFNPATGVWAVTGPLADVNAALAAVAFVPAANWDQDFTITVRVRDAGNTGPADGTITVTVTPVNDAPVIAGTAAGQTVNDNAALSPFSAVTITDADSPAQIQTVSVSLDDAAKGSFTTLNGFVDASGGVYSFSGTAAAAQSAIRGLVFTPSANRVVPGSTETTTFTISADDGVAAPVTNNTTAVVSTSVNDVPMATNLDQSKSTTEDGGTLALDDIVVTDPDAGETITATLTLSNAAAGSLTTGTYGSATSTYNAGTWTVTGSVSDVNAALAAMAFSPAANWDQSFTITARIRDAANTGPMDGTISVTVIPVNDVPMATDLNQSKSTTEDGGTLALDDIVVTDPDEGETITATLTLSNAAAGSLTTGTYGSATSTYNAGTWTVTGSVSDVNAALAAVAFNPAANWDQNFTITTRIRDAANTGPMDGTISVTVIPVNDAPVIAGTASGQAVNDNATISPFTAVTITDVDSPVQTQTVSVRLDDAAKGSFTTLNGFVDASGGVYSFSGTAAAAQSAIRGLVFTPSANRVAPGSTETTTFTISVNDGIAAPVTDNTTTVIATSVNDAPVIAGTAAGQTVNDNAALSPFSAVTITDADSPAQTQTVSVRLDDAAKGSFTALNGFIDASGGVYNFSGTAAAAQTAIRGLVLTPAANRVAPGSTETTTFTISVDDGIAAPVTDNTTTVIATSVNDAPTATNLDQTISFTEDDASVTLNDIVVTDPDEGETITATLTISAPTAGSLTTGTYGSATSTFNSTTGVWTVTGSIADVNENLAAMSFTPAANWDQDFTITAHVEDAVETGPEDGTITVTVTPVNDAPVITAPATIDVDEDVPAALTDISFSDVDAGSGNVTVTFSVPSGSLSAASGGGVTVGGTSSDLTLTGTIADINAFIASSGVTYTTALNETGNVTLTVEIDDNGNTGAGGAQEDTATITLVVTEINDAPVNTVPGGQTVDQNGVLVFSATNSNAISVADIDAGEGFIRVTLTATNGLLTLSGTTGLTFSAGDGTGDGTMTFEGTIADINLALAGLAFAPTGGYNGPASLQIVSDDNGLSGAGGTRTDTDEISITVTSISPTVNTTGSLNPDGTYKIDDAVILTVTFDQTVTVDESGGSPTLLLETGATDREAVYESGSGSNTLAFTYTVKAGDHSADLDYASTTALALNGATIQNATADDAVLTLPAVDGSNSIAGQHGIVIDGVAPAAPSRPLLYADDDTGASGSDHITNVTAPRFTGTAEAGSTVRLYDTDGATELGQAVATDGNWTITSDVLSEGTHTLTVVATDAAGNPGEASEERLVVIDITAPAVPSGLTVSFGDQQNTLEWTANTEPDFEAYLVHGGTTTNPSMLLQVSETTFTDTGLENGTVYYYGVRAMDIAGNLSAVSEEVSATPKAPQTITFDALSAKTYGDSDFDAGATSTNSSIPIAYSSSDETVATIVGGKIHIVGAGTTDITASQAGSESYTAATDVILALEIRPATLTVTAVGGQQKVYGQADPVFTFTVDGYQYNDDETVFQGALGRDTGEDVGDYKLRVGDLSAGDNYGVVFHGDYFSITPATLTVTAVGGQQKVYGQADPVFTFTVDGYQYNDDEAMFQGALGRDAGEDVGDYKLRVGDLSAGDNYSVVFHGDYFGITPATLTVTADAGQGKIYGQADSVFTYTVDGYQRGDDEVVLQGTLGRDAGEDVGDYKLRVGDLSAGDNYSVVFHGDYFGITPATLTVTADTGQGKIYGQADSVFTYTVDGYQYNDDETVFQGALSRDAGEDVGDYKLRQGTLDAGTNYSLIFHGANFAVIPKGLVITARDTVKVYDGTLYHGGNGVDFDGFVGDEGPEDLDGHLSFSGTSQGAKDAGKYLVVPGGLTSLNYGITFVGDTLHIHKAPLLISAVDTGKVYGDDNPVLEFRYEGLAKGDSGTATVPEIHTAATVGSPVGSYPINVSGAADDNYTVTYNDGELEVGPRVLTLTLNAEPAIVKIYDGTKSAELAPENYTLHNVVPGDNIRVTGNAVYAQAEVGNGISVTVTDFVLDGKEAGNYVLETTSATVVGSIMPGVASAANSTFDVSPAAAGEPVTVTIAVRDAHDNVIKSLPPDALAVTVTGANSADMKIINNGDGTYTAVYTPQRGGKDEVTVLLGGTAIAGSPFEYTVAGLPGMPVNLRGAPGNEQVTLEWEAPVDGGLGITDYAIEYSTDGQSWTRADHTPTTNTRVAVIGLDNNRAYRFRVAAVNGSGTGPFSAELGGIIPTEPVPDTGGNLPEPAPGETVVITDGRVEAVVLEVVDSEYLRLRGDGYAMELASLGVDGKRIPISAIDAVIRLVRGAGTGVYVSGSGFEPGTVVTVYLFSVPELVGHLPVDADGRFAGTLAVPTHLEAGKHTLQANGVVAGGNGERSVSVGLLLVDNRPQQITFGALTDRIYGDDPVTVTATATSGLPVSYTVTDMEGKATGIASIAGGNRLHIRGAGDIRIVAAQKGDADHAEASPAVQRLHIAKAPLSVSAGDDTRAYGEANPAFELTYSGFVNGDKASALTVQPAAATEATETSAPGSYAISISGGQSANYAFTYHPAVLTVTKAAQAITFTAPAEVTRDAGSLQLDVSASSGLPVVLSLDDPQVAVLSGSTLDILRLGTVTVTATQAGDGNYEAAEPVNVTLRVTDPSGDFPIRVHQAVSPNGDGINEFLMVEGIRDHAENRVTVISRNGTVLWEAAGYDNDRVAFRGISTAGLQLPAGTYFYIVEVKVNGKWEYKKGYFVLRY